MESPTLSDWVAIVAQVCVAVVMMAMGLLSHSRQGLTSKAALWGFLFSLPWLWEDTSGFSFALLTFPVLFILLTHIGHAIRGILTRTGFLATKGKGGTQTMDGTGQG